MSLVEQSRNWWKRDADPAQVRMLCQGLAPVSPDVRFYALFRVATDADHPLAPDALRALQGAEEEDIKRALRNPELPPELIDFFAQVTDSEEVLIEVVRHSELDYRTLRLVVGKSPSASVLEAVSRKHSLLERDLELVDWLLACPTTPSFDKQTLGSIFQRSIPSERSHPMPMKTEEATEPEPVRQSEVGHEPESPDELEGRRMGNLRKEIGNLTMGQLIHLAKRGDKETRSILLSQPDVVIRKAVLENPKITEEEVIKISMDRTIDAELLRMISLNREWSRNPTIRANLVKNPKTPLGVALPLLGTLSKSELERIVNTKVLSSTIRTQAEKLLKGRV